MRDPIRSGFAFATLAVCATCFNVSCKPKASGASVKAFEIDASNSFIAPKPHDAWAYAVTGSTKPLTPEVVAQKAGVLLERKAGREYKTTLTADGESVLFLQDTPTPPKPWYSVDAGGKVFAWSYPTYQLRDILINPNIYVRHEKGMAARVEYDTNKNGKNLFLMHFPKADDGIHEPILVPDTQHFIIAGVGYYRLGNKIFDSVTRLGSLEFRELGSRIWSYDGDSFNVDVKGGTVFWSPDLKTFYSVAPESATAVKWSTRDGEVLHKEGTISVAEAKMPAPAASMLKINTKLGLHKRKEGELPRITYDIEAADRNTVLVYQYEGMIEKKKAGFGLADDAPFASDDDYLPEGIRRAQKTEGHRPKGLSLAGQGNIPRYDPKLRYPDGYQVLVDTPFGQKVGVTNASTAQQKANGWPEWARGKSDEVSQQVLLYDGKPDDLKFTPEGKVDPGQNTATQVLNQKAHNGNTTQPYYDGVPQTIIKQNAAIEKERTERADLEQKFKEDTARADKQMAEYKAEQAKTDQNHTVDGIARNLGESTLEYAGGKLGDKLKAGVPGAAKEAGDLAAKGLGVDAGTATKVATKLGEKALDKGVDTLTDQAKSLANDGLTVATGNADKRGDAETGAKDAKNTSGNLLTDLQDGDYLRNRAAEGAGEAAGKGVEWIAKPLGPVGGAAAKEVKQDVVEIGKGLNTINAYERAGESADQLAANRAASAGAQQSGGRFANALKVNQDTAGEKNDPATPPPDEKSRTPAAKPDAAPAPAASSDGAPAPAASSDATAPAASSDATAPAASSDATTQAAKSDSTPAAEPPPAPPAPSE